MKNKKKVLRSILIILIGVVITFILVACSTNIKTEEKEDQNSLVNEVKSDTSNELQIIIQESPPFSFSKDGEFTGFVTEMVKEVMYRQDISTPFTVLPFKRGYELVSEQPMTVLCGMTRTEEREDLFKWVGPVAQVTTGFYAKKGSKVVLDSLEDAKKIESIGVTLGYYTEKLLLEAGFENLEQATYPEDMLEKFLLGRNTLILSDNIAISGLLENATTMPNEVEMIYKVLSTKSYIAFSLGTPDEIVQQWQDAFDAAYLDGTIQEIYDIWLPNEKAPSKD